MKKLILPLTFFTFLNAHAEYSIRSSYTGRMAMDENGQSQEVECQLLQQKDQNRNMNKLMMTAKTLTDESGNRIGFDVLRVAWPKADFHEFLRDADYGSNCSEGHDYESVANRVWMPGNEHENSVGQYITFCFNRRTQELASVSMMRTVYNDPPNDQPSSLIKCSNLK